jgi:hypothetical protein
MVKSKKKQTNKATLRDYSIISSKKIPFYEKNNNNKKIIPITRKIGGTLFANEGPGPHTYTGTVVFTTKMIFINLGFNTYLPLLDLNDGEILLSSSGTRERFKQVMQEKEYLDDDQDIKADLNQRNQERKR